MNKFVYLVLTFLGLPVAFAQQATPPGNPSSAPTVLAEMSGYKLTNRDFEVLLDMLPSVNKQTLTPAQKEQLIKNWMRVVTFSKEAQAKGLDQDPAIAEQMEMFRKRLLYELYQKELLSQVSVPEEEIRTYFEEHKEQFQTPGQVRVSRILVPTKEKADEVRQAIAQGVPFEQLAKERSTDGVSRQQGGDVGWIQPGHKEADLLRVAQSLETNQISEPFSSPIGWQVVKVTDKRPAERKEFKDVEKTISQQLLLKKQREFLEATANELSKKYEVKIHEAGK